ncbi:MAG: hypothetical protein K8S97_13485 [Anaerolineae bacterium]|nr:hypothetical protein [Anaerolineae bacterium]
MRFLRRVIGFGLAALFVLLLPLSLWTYNGQRILLSGNTYKEMFTDEDFYDDLVPRVLPALLTDLDASQPAQGEVAFRDLIDHTPAREWERIAPALVPREWVEREVNQNLDATLDWLDEDRDLELVFHTDVVRRQLNGRAGEQAVAQMIAAMPSCTLEEERDLDAFMQGAADVEFPYCRPANASLSASLDELMHLARVAAAAELPDEIDVIAEMRAEAEVEAALHPDDPFSNDPDPFSDKDLNQFRSAVRLWKQLLLLTLMIPLAVLSMIVIVAIRSAKSFFRWVGWSLILGSMITLAPLFFLPFIAPHLTVETELEDGFVAGGSLIAEVVSHRVFEMLIGQFTWPVLIQAALLIGIGFVFAVLSVLLLEPDRKPVPAGMPISGTPSSMPSFGTPAGYHVYQPPSDHTPQPAATGSAPRSETHTQLDSLPGVAALDGSTPTGAPPAPPDDDTGA